MVKSKEIAGPSCLTRAADDEPLFELRANDELAPDVVRRWAFCYVNAKGGTRLHLTKAQIAKVDEAHAIAREMEHWREMNCPTPPSTETAA
jgi:hypothetical protein